MIKNGPNLCLRPMEPTDWPQISHWFYDGAYSDFFRDVPTALNVEGFMTYANMKNGYTFLARLNRDADEWPIGTCVGAVIVYEINWVAATCKLGVLVDKEFWGKTYSMEAIWLIGDYIVNRLKFRKIICEIVASNTRLAKIVQHGGFKQEAIFKDDAIVDGKPTDIIRFCQFDFEARERLKTFEEEHYAIHGTSSGSR